MTHDISIILAAKDEGPTIADVIARCRAATPGLREILVIDDGSGDDTAARAQAAGATVHRLPENRGKGVAIRHGMERAAGDVLLFLDADGQDDPEDIPRLVEALSPGVDMVVGSRFLGTFLDGAITPLNRAGNVLLTQVVNGLFRARLTDTQAGFRLVRRAAAERVSLSASRYNIEVDLLLGVLRSGGRVVEVPVTRRRRAHGRSGLRSFRDGTLILGHILRRRFGPVR